MRGGWSEVVSELAVWDESADRGSLSFAGVGQSDWVQFAVNTTGNQPEANSTSDNRALYLSIAILAMAGVAVSAVSLERHYAKSATAFCDVGEKFNCDLLNRSAY